MSISKRLVVAIINMYVQKTNTESTYSEASAMCGV